MKQRPRFYYTEAQKAEMWDRWQKGDSLHFDAWSGNSYYGRQDSRAPSG